MMIEKGARRAAFKMYGKTIRDESKRAILLAGSLLFQLACASNLLACAEEVSSSDSSVTGQSRMLHSQWFGNTLSLSTASQTSEPMALVLSQASRSATVTTPKSLVMQEFPRENGDTGTGQVVVVAEPDVLKLTKEYFSSEKDPRVAYEQACSQQDAHFNEPAYYYRKATILMQMGSYSKAEQILKGSVIDVPNNSDFHLARAYCYFKLGNKTAALDELGMARFHNPRLPQDIEFD